MRQLPLVSGPIISHHGREMEDGTLTSPTNTCHTAEAIDVRKILTRVGDKWSRSASWNAVAAARAAYDARLGSPVAEASLRA